MVRERTQFRAGAATANEASLVSSLPLPPPSAAPRAAGVPAFDARARVERVGVGERVGHA